MVEPGSHLDVAVMCLIARYLRRQRLALVPLRRSALPPGDPGESVLQTAYGDVVGDAARHCARMLLGPGCGGHLDTHDAEQMLVANIAPMLRSPEAFEALADEVAGPFAAEARRFAEILRIQREALAAIVEGATGGPGSGREGLLPGGRSVSGRFDRHAEVMVTAAQKDALPDIDLELYAEDQDASMPPGRAGAVPMVVSAPSTGPASRVRSAGRWPPLIPVHPGDPR